MLKNVFKIIAIFVIGTVGGIFADQILWPYFIERPLFLEYRLDPNPIYLTEQVFIEEETLFQEAIQKVDRMVVGIKTETATGEFLEGSGLIVTSDGLIITLANLVSGSSKTTIFFEDKTFTPEIPFSRCHLAFPNIPDPPPLPSSFPSLQQPPQAPVSSPF